VVNPGSVSKKQTAGTYARLIMEPLEISDEEREKDETIGHRLYERCRADIIRI
jgi:DNA polymerase alpha subunit B